MQVRRHVVLISLRNVRRARDFISFHMRPQMMSCVCSIIAFRAVRILDGCIKSYRSSSHILSHKISHRLHSINSHQFGNVHSLKTTRHHRRHQFPFKITQIWKLHNKQRPLLLNEDSDRPSFVLVHALFHRQVALPLPIMIHRQ